MPFILKNSIITAFRSSWIILKLIVPIYILADILFYYDALKHITFIFAPIAGLLNLPAEATLSIVSGLFLNIYAAIAFAAPLGLSPHQWTILAVFLGIAHSLLVETEIMKKLGIPRRYSILLRLSVGASVGFAVTLFPSSWFREINTNQIATEQSIQYDSLFALFQSSLFNALWLSLQVIALVSLLIFFLDFLKSLSWVKNHTQKVNSGFSIAVGVILGITYGAGILIAEYEKGILQKKDILFIGTYLMICHAIIEDTLLFVIFGANIWIIVGLRILFATLFAFGVAKVWKTT